MMQHMMDVGMMWDMGLGGVRVMSVSPLKAGFHRLVCTSALCQYWTSALCSIRDRPPLEAPLITI